MSRISATLALTAALSLAPSDFFVSIEDLPLAPGLADTGQGFDFEDSGGRILTVIAEGSADPASVRAFYRETLPALGWAEVPGGITHDPALEFARGRERLTLFIAATSDGARLEARLVVHPAPMD